MALQGLDYAQDAPSDEEASRLERELSDRLQLLGATISRLATKRVGERAQIEQRWLEDLRQYNGQYDVATATALTEDDTKSRAFVNKTRSKVGTAESRMIKMLFPADERNWAIRSTPVPQLTKAAHDSSVAGTRPDGQALTVSELAQTELQAAKEHAEAMEVEVDDQLEESRYYSACRDIIHQGVVLGTGVIKAPVVVGRMRKKWRKVTDQSGNAAHVLERVPEHRPAAFFVDAWDFYPDLSVTRYEDSESDIERHRMRKAELAKMVNDPGAIESEIRAVLAEDPRSHRTTGAWISEMREISGVSRINEEAHLYEVWEYNGPISKEDLLACGIGGFIKDEDDELEQYEGRLLVAHERVISAIVNPMDTQDRPYSMWCWEKDDTCVFGFGVPWQARHAQRVLNGAWRMVLENGALSTGPQTVISRKQVEPADGDWKLRARKVWYTKDGADPRTAFWTFDIENHQPALMAIVEKAERFFDDETALPLIAQGQNAPGTTKTASGMELLMNSANIQLSAAVKNWDDDITVPVITRYYDWNMQYNPKDAIKGDQEVLARGSSVLLVREMLAQNLMMLLGLAGANPMLAKLTNWGDAYREVVKALQLPHTSIVYSDEEVQQKEANAPPQQDPNVLKIEFMREQHTAEMADREANRAHLKEMQALERETTLIGMADKYQLSVEQMRAKLEQQRMSEQNKRDLYLDERDLKVATGQGI